MQNIFKNIIKKKYKYFFFFLVLLFVLMPILHASALEVVYPTIPGFPNINQTANQNLPSYIDYFFGVAMISAGILGVISIVIAGINLLMAFGNPSAISEARERIFGSMLGIVLLMFSFILLQTINPALVSPRTGTLASNTYVGLYEFREAGLVKSPGTKNPFALITTANAVGPADGLQQWNFTPIDSNYIEPNTSGDKNIGLICFDSPDGSTPDINFEGYADPNNPDTANPSRIETKVIRCRSTSEYYAQHLSEFKHDSVPITGVKSFSTAPVAAGIYLFSEPGCGGAMSIIPITQTGDIPNAWSGGRLKSVKIYNGNGPADERTSAIFTGTGGEGACSIPYSNLDAGNAGDNGDSVQCMDIQPKSCNPTPEVHSECQNDSCVPVNGPGTNECLSSQDCTATPTTHNVCDPTSQKCISEPGAGSDECPTEGDSCTPSNPSNPYGPGDPYSPSNPYGPCDSYGPSNPYMPGNPYGTSNPWSPGNPYGTSNPYTPLDPYGPCNPYGPSNPHSNPYNPGGPYGPSNPYMPGNPYGPCVSYGPSNPYTPGAPYSSNNPYTPDNPYSPSNPYPSGSNPYGPCNPNDPGNSNPGPFLTVDKLLDPVDDPGRFGLYIDGVLHSPGEVGNNGSTGPVLLDIGPHTVSEVPDQHTNMTDYTATFTGDCTSNGNGTASITLASGDNKNCVITNTNNHTSSSTTKLKLVKVVNGGPLAGKPGHWDLTATPAIGAIGGLTITDNGANPVFQDAQVNTTYNLAEDPPSTTGYTASAWDCTGGTATMPSPTEVRITAGEVTCTITNTSANANPTLLTVVKHVVGSNALPDSFLLDIDGTVVSSGDPITVTPGNHTVGELNNNDGTFQETFSPNCPDGNIDVAEGTSETCIITNTFTPPVTPPVPKLRTPPDGTRNVSLTPTLTWTEAAPGAASYYIEVARANAAGQPDFSTPEIHDTVYTTSYDVSGLYPGVLYYWHVSASNGTLTSNFQATPFKFRTAPLPSGPPAPVLISPGRNATNVSLSPVLTWVRGIGSVGITDYYIQLFNKVSGVMIIDGLKGNNTPSISSSSLTPSSVYSWRVATVNANGQGVFSGTWDFTTRPAALPKLGTPDNPVPYNGFVGGATTHFSSYTLNWRMLPLGRVDSYNIQISTRSNLASPLVNQTINNANPFITPALTANTVYYWRAQDLDSTGAFTSSDWSPVWHFKTASHLTQNANPFNLALFSSTENTIKADTQSIPLTSLLNVTLANAQTNSTTADDCNANYSYTKVIHGSNPQYEAAHQSEYVGNSISFSQNTRFAHLTRKDIGQVLAFPADGSNGGIVGPESLLNSSYAQGEASAGAQLSEVLAGNFLTAVYTQDQNNKDFHCYIKTNHVEDWPALYNTSAEKEDGMYIFAESGSY